ncbi:MAG TPA: hypothetical protein VHB46_02025 [Burkholderiales bacterium]|nr:hypothetical protein [Burkholderiales bacterium]
MAITLLIAGGNRVHADVSAPGPVSDAASHGANAGAVESSRPDSILLVYGGRVVPPMESSRLPAGNDAVPEPRKWDRALPFFAQRVLDRGIDLPNPYDVGLSLYVGGEDRDLSNLSVGFNNGTPGNLAFVQFPHTRIDNQSAQFQAGAWLFPFMNVYGILGYTQGKGDIDITMSGRELMQYLGVPGCNLGPALRPELCDRTLSGTAHANYSGTSYGAGMTLAGAWKDLFFSLPVTYVVADTSVSDTSAKTWNIAPRVGWNQHLSEGMVTWYAGGTYMISKMSIEGSVTFPTAGTAIGRDTSLQYAIKVEPSDAWNYLAGAHWMVSKSWSVLAEVGFGGSREDVIMAAFYRF